MELLKSRTISEQSKRVRDVDNIPWFENIHMLRGLVLLMLICLAANSFAQTSHIKGVIRDEKTKEPLPFATIFLASTSLGANANAEGAYDIGNIPTGKYDLTVSMLGYELKTIPVAVSGNPVALNVTLKQVPELLATVTVTGKKEDRKKLEKLFKTYFLGNTRNAKKCVIQNLDKIAMGEEDEVFTASCDEPIIIENQATGYRISYFLKQFIVDFKKGTSTFAGIPRFENLIPKTSKDKKGWDKERLRAYNGSITHFMRALKSHRLDEEKYEINLKCDGTKKQVFYKDLFAANSNSVLKFHCILDVFYVNERPEGAYGPSIGQFSELKLAGKELIIYSNGYYEPPLDLELNGYFGWEKMADIVPYEYAPETTAPNSQAHGN